MRLIDADVLDMYECLKSYYGDAWRDAQEEIENAPTVDAEPVIRCRDCKYLRLTGMVWRCQNELVMMLCEPDDYCSRAVRNGE